jgi:predicted ester cyclase
MRLGKPVMSHFDWMREWYERGWGAGDEEVLRQYAADDFEDLWHGTTGVDSLVVLVQELHRTFPDLTLEVTDQAGTSERLTTVWRMYGTDRGGLFDLAPTGKQVEIPAICLDDIVERHVVRHQQVSDMLRAFRQLEVIPVDWKAERPLR